MEPEKKKVFVIGVGLTKFYKPSRKDIGDYPQFAPQAIRRALRDSGVKYEDIQRVFIGYAYGDSC